MWNMWAATKLNRVLLADERKKFAMKALKIMDSCNFIDCRKRNELDCIAAS